jgi:anti-sigma factor RsiW
VINCDRVMELLGDYSMQKLPEPERSRIADHLMQCAACADEAEGYFEVVCLVRSLPTPRPPPDVEQRLRKSVAEAFRSRVLRPEAEES